MIKNKRGQFGEFVIPIVIILSVVLLLGLGTGIKVFSIIKSIPTRGWIIIGVMFLLLILPKRSKK